MSAPEAHTVICLRAEDTTAPRIVGSLRTPCAACGAPVTVSPATHAAAGPSARYVCLGCGLEAIAEAGGIPRFAPVTSGQVAEILPHLAREN